MKRCRELSSAGTVIDGQRGRRRLAVVGGRARRRCGRRRRRGRTGQLGHVGEPGEAGRRCGTRSPRGRSPPRSPAGRVFAAQASRLLDPRPGRRPSGSKKRWNTHISEIWLVTGVAVAKVIAPGPRWSRSQSHLTSRSRARADSRDLDAVDASGEREVLRQMSFIDHEVAEAELFESDRAVVVVGAVGELLES